MHADHPDSATSTSVIILRGLLFLAGAGLVFRAVMSAILTFVLPRGVSDRITRRTFLTMRRIMEIWEKTADSYEARDRIWSLFAPLTLLLLPLVWLIFVFFGYAAIFVAVGVDDIRIAFTDSGSSLLTLGFAPLANFTQVLIAFTEAIVGLALIALLIAYLPTIYSAWARREALVTLLAVRAGEPASPEVLFRRYARLGRLDKLTELWEQWEVWFADLEESHTSLAALALFRSSQPYRSWVVAGCCVMDAASLMTSTIDLPPDPQAALAIRGGTLAFRRVCTLFGLPFNPEPEYPTDPISVSRADWDLLCMQLTEAGIPLKPDRDQAWLAFAGWRVNYDTVVRALARLTNGPEAPWSSDRAITYHRNRADRIIETRKAVNWPRQP